MRNIKLKIQYDGTDYHGWQIQKNDITVQEIVKKAVQKIVNEDVHLTGCGRTDTGVHAENYVCNFFTNSRIPSEKLPYALNTYLPKYSEGLSSGTATSTAFLVKAVSTTLNLNVDIIPIV